MSDEVKLKEVKRTTVVYESGWRYVFGMVVMLMWFMGIVLAEGKLEVAGTIVFPPYALYLTVEHLCSLVGFI
ncbi:hypothetical protein D3C85_15150 [compost metagenome]